LRTNSNPPIHSPVSASSSRKGDPHLGLALALNKTRQP
jgi:hypothetical protein